MSAHSTSITAETRTPGSRELDRRTFLGTVGLTAGAVLAASVAPLVAHAAGDSTPRDVPASSAVGKPAVESTAGGLWDVDDMWGNRPRYAHPIPYAHGIPGAGGLERSGPYFERLSQ